METSLLENPGRFDVEHNSTVSLETRETVGSKVLVISQSLAVFQQQLQKKKKSCASRGKREPGVAVVEGGTPDSDTLSQCHPFSSKACLSATLRAHGSGVTVHAVLTPLLWDCIAALPQSLEAGKPGRDFAVVISNLADFCQPQE